jgi:hypothetical protein
VITGIPANLSGLRGVDRARDTIEAEVMHKHQHLIAYTLAFHLWNEVRLNVAIYVNLFSRL